MMRQRARCPKIQASRQLGATPLLKTGICRLKLRIIFCSCFVYCCGELKCKTAKMRKATESRRKIEHIL